MNKLKWLHLGLTVITLILLIILFFKLPKQMNESTILELQRKALREELVKIPKDSTIIERYYHTKEVMKEQLVEFEQADSLERDSLFWFYYLSWKNE